MRSNAIFDMITWFFDRFDDDDYDDYDYINCKRINFN